MQTPKKATHPGNLGEHTAGGVIGAAVGTVTGAAAVTAAITEGALVGSAAGPMGVVAGAGIGGVIGALAGKGIAQIYNPTTEDAYWRDNYKTRSYVKSGESYDTYKPAYRHGAESFTKYNGADFETVEPKIKEEWDVSGATMPWTDARPASRDAYDRLNKINKDTLTTKDIDTRTGE